MHVKRESVFVTLLNFSLQNADNDVFCFKGITVMFISIWRFDMLLKYSAGYLLINTSCWLNGIPFRHEMLFASCLFFSFCFFFASSIFSRNWRQGWRSENEIPCNDLTYSCSNNSILCKTLVTVASKMKKLSEATMPRALKFGTRHHLSYELSSLNTDRCISWRIW